MSAAVDARFAAAMVKLAEFYSGRTLTEGLIRGYANALADLTPEQWKTAFARAVKECRYFPTVAELRQFVLPSADDAAVLAWTALRKAARDVGAYSSLVVVDGPAALALETVFAAGWPEFCAQEEGPALHARRTEFLAAYRDARRHAPGARRLRGLCETTGPYALDGRSWTALLTTGGEVRPQRDGQRRLRA